jgi:hypothetical protein
MVFSMFQTFAVFTPYRHFDDRRNPQPKSDKKAFVKPNCEFHPTEVCFAFALLLGIPSLNEYLIPKRLYKGRSE